MIVEIEFDWSVKFTKEKLAELERLTGAPPKMDEKGEHLYYSSRTFVLHLEDALAITNEFKIIRVVNGKLTSQLDELLERLKKFEPSNAVKFNEHTQSAVPDSPLFHVKEVKVIEDACTYDINDALKEGWHIIACCPQAQRRPDYVLGK